MFKDLLDEKTQKRLNDIEFVESASTSVATQNALLESLENENVKGRFSSAEDMFSHMMKEWEENDSEDVKE